eukprot:scaffold12565_cov121-Isochrysis_galbana.AAC.4
MSKVTDRSSGNTKSREEVNGNAPSPNAQPAHSYTYMHTLVTLEGHILWIWRANIAAPFLSLPSLKEKKIFRRKRFTLAATRRDTSVPCRPDIPPPPSHSSPIPSPSSGRLLRRDGFRAACTTNSLWARVLRV